jgi:hypothetical protein
MAQDECPAYIEKSEKMLNEEKGRVESYLHKTSMDALLKACYEHLLKKHQADLLKKNTGMTHMLSSDLTDDLSRLYRLYSRFPEDLDPIGVLFQEYIAKVGSEMVDKVFTAEVKPEEKKKDEKKDEKKEEKKEDSKSEDSLVKNLIDLHARFGDMVKHCFQTHQVFQKSLKKAFEVFINKDNRLSKLLAQFAHDVLRKNSPISGRNIETTLDNVVFLFGYIQDKDVFEYDYESCLAERLLMGTSESEHREKVMIAKLKTECGYQWTNKLDTMFKDILLSKDMLAKFKKEIYDSEKQEDMAFHVNVCTKGIWPHTAGSNTAIIPTEVKNVCDKFKRFYINLHNNHKLEYRLDQVRVPSLSVFARSLFVFFSPSPSNPLNFSLLPFAFFLQGQAEIQVQFNSTTKRTLVVTTYQMMVMLLFNGSIGKVLKAKDIATLTGVSLDELENHLLSLVHPKAGVLDKLPNGPTLADDHKLRVNQKFANKLLKITIPLLPKKKEATQNSSKNTVNAARQHMVDAAVVRIMKSRNQLKHNELIAEVVNQIKKFVPSPQLIRSRIDVLIEQEYMKRDPNDRSAYVYVA